MLFAIDAGVLSMLNNWTFCPSIKGENTSINAKPTSARFNKKNRDEKEKKLEENKKTKTKYVSLLLVFKP